MMSHRCSRDSYRYGSINRRAQRYRYRIVVPIQVSYQSHLFRVVLGMDMGRTFIHLLVANLRAAKPARAVEVTAIATIPTTTRYNHAVGDYRLGRETSAGSSRGANDGERKFVRTSGGRKKGRRKSRRQRSRKSGPTGIWFCISGFLPAEIMH